MNSEDNFVFIFQAKCFLVLWKLGEGGWADFRTLIKSRLRFAWWLHHYVVPLVCPSPLRCARYWFRFVLLLLLLLLLFYTNENVVWFVSYWSPIFTMVKDLNFDVVITLMSVSRSCWQSMIVTYMGH